MTKREERWAADFGWIKEIVQKNMQAKKRNPVTHKRYTPLCANDSPAKSQPEEDTRPTFDASSWKPTQKVLELLGKADRRQSEPVVSVADLNEQKYGGDQLTYEDRLMAKTSESKSNRYERIESMAGNNGDCHSRKTTYRRLKFGRGNLSLSGYLKEGFEQNRT